MGVGDVVAIEDDQVRLIVRDGANDQGQAHATTWGLLLAERLRLPVEAVVLELGDTAHVPHGEGTGSARSTMLAGGAVAAAGDELLDALGALPRPARGGGGRRRAHRRRPVLGRGRSRGVGLVARRRPGRPVVAEFDYEQDGPTFPAGCHAAVVEVDSATGAVRLLRFVAVDDCGTVVNPEVVAGQQQGGIVQGVAQALCEEVVHDDDGNLLTSTFADYGIPSAAELPSIEVATVDVVTGEPLGAKGIGQAGAIGSTIAVQNAVIDAVAHLGVRHIDLPLTAERVWRAIVDARRGAVPE